jgi:hypothetical protein
MFFAVPQGRDNGSSDFRGRDSVARSDAKNAGLVVVRKIRQFPVH